MASEPDAPGHFVEDFCPWQNNPACADILQRSALPHIAAQLMQSDTAWLHHDQLLVKKLGTRQATPWHQDQPHDNVSGRQNVSLWIPVYPVPLASTLRFVASSHAGIWYIPRTLRDHQAKWLPEGVLAELPEIAANPERFLRLGCALEPGDCVALHMLSLHASSGIGPSSRRRVFSARSLGDDTRHAPCPWRTPRPLIGLTDRTSESAELNDPLFPLVWPVV